LNPSLICKGHVGEWLDVLSINVVTVRHWSECMLIIQNYRMRRR